jgi:hypothetical protein
MREELPFPQPFGKSHREAKQSVGNFELEEHHTNCRCSAYVKYGSLVFTAT